MYICHLFHISLLSCCDEVCTLEILKTSGSVDVSINDDVVDTINESIVPVDVLSKRMNECDW